MKSSKWALATTLLLLGACAKPAPQAQAPAAAPAVDTAARTAEWKAIAGTRTQLEHQREELASLREQAAAGAAVGPQIADTRAGIAKLADELTRRLAAYINADPPVAGKPMSPEQLAAVRMKSGEDLLLGRDYIDLQGDYRTAADIYQKALAFDSDNIELKRAFDEAMAKQFMSPERFAQVRKGMAQAQVIALLGRPLGSNVREYPEKKVTAWLYPKNAAGEAAGVFFTADKVVYASDYNAVRRTSSGGGS
jgi:tetratricopeptide (TPR) repeat protein